jgi:hypothetical protein
MADAKAEALENEVGALREEVKTLKVIVDPPESTANKIQI